MEKLRLMQQIQFELANKGVPSFLGSNNHGNTIYVHHYKGMDVIESLTCHQTTEQELQQWLDVLVYGPQKSVELNAVYEG